MCFFDGSTVLVTGGTGSFGHRFVERILGETDCEKLIVLSRDEMKQWSMRERFKSDKRLRMFIGDVRDRERLYRALQGVDYVVHAAATKIVPVAEYDPFECIKTNVIGAMNVIDAAIDCGVKRLVALSTDKASSPTNLYGASKLASDKLFIAANSYGGGEGCRFSVVRYGNVMGSRGSLIPALLDASVNGVFSLTHPQMTRFMISLDESVDLVFQAFKEAVGGEIFVKKIPSMRVKDVIEALRPDLEIKETGIRPGEKVHEQMIGEEDNPYTYEYPSYYKILPSIHRWNADAARIGDGRPVSSGFRYTSDRNKEWMSADVLRAWVERSGSQIIR
ncbi:UDP-N-acetylglucosamine 4,6-dehydratase (inverting) [Litoricolaceae bacterium]|nr:UDP-N-acetylglucosamine 4,6-dehydratase (inverting) [Litorivicinaceae bacterium]